METVIYTSTNTRNNLNTAIRILLAALFLLSALAKIYGMSPSGALATFEQTQLVTMGFSDDVAVHFSRILIGCEFAIGALLLQNHYFKRFILPVSFLMLLVFCIHLSYVIATKGNSGNCGCFGELLPMTPLQAIIKNVIAMGLMALLFTRVHKENDKLNFFIPLSVVLAFVLMLYMIAPVSKATMAIQSTAFVPEDDVKEPEIQNSGVYHTADADTAKIKDNSIKVMPSDPAAKLPEEIIAAPKKKASGYKQYFSDIDKEKKILCFFAPGCEHCQATIKDLTELKKTDKTFPDIRIIFMDEEAELIPAFFDQAGAKYPYFVMDIANFWKTLGGDRNTPGVLYLWNGNQIKFFDGIEQNQFKKAELKTIVAKPWTK